MRIVRVAPALLAMAVALTLPTVAAAAPAAAGGIGRGTATVLDQPRHGVEAVDRLGGALASTAARNGQSAASLRTLLQRDPAMWLDRTGQVFAVEPIAAGPAAPVAMAAVAPATAEALTLHSKPGSKRVIYLDFDGQLVKGTGWNDAWNGNAPFTAAPYDTDHHPSTFSAAELGVIKSVWQRVSEDYAPFDVDITTQQPSAEAIDRAGIGDDVFGTTALITSTSMGYRSCHCGGVSYVGTFDAPNRHAYYQPAFIFQQGTGSAAKPIAEAASHEVGHTLGLHHDGSATAGYFAGQGPWAPIMGVGYYKPVSQWSRGEYRGANNHEDDVAVMIAHGAPLRADDHGNLIASATVVSGANPRVAGRIASRGDIDTFSFSTGGGVTTLAVVPATTGPDLDVQLRLVTTTGRQVAISNPLIQMLSVDTTGGLAALLRVNLPRGTYVALVDGVGAGSALSTGYSDYGSLGAYTFSAAIAAPAPEAPTAATAQVTGTGATVRWTDRSSNEVGFEVLREQYDATTRTWSAPAVVRTTWANVATVADNPPVGTYRYRVRAVNAVGRSAAVVSPTVSRR